MKVIKYGIAFILCVASASAQNIMTSSPYSMYGIGESSDGHFGLSSAMAGTAFGVRENLRINTENPAGLTSMDTLKLIAETSAFAKFESYASHGNSNDAFTGNFSTFSIGGRIMKRWYTAFGVSPYSFVGYYFKANQQLEGSPTEYYKSTFEGDGGLSKATLSNAFMLMPNLSIGANVSYIFGNIYETETQSAMTVKKQMYAHLIHADFGLQYSRQLAKEMALTIGAVYSYKQRVNFETGLTVTGTSTSTNYNENNVHQYLPQYYGIGAALSYKKYVFAADFYNRDYSVLTSGVSNVKFRNAQELRLGTVYTPGGYSSSGLWKRVVYRGGLAFTRPNMKVNDKEGLGLRISGGLGFPVQGGQISLGFFYDHLQYQSALKRNLTGFTITYTLSERMYRVKL